MFSSYLIPSATPGPPFPNNSVTVNLPQPRLTKPVFSCQEKATLQHETGHVRSEPRSFQKLNALIDDTQMAFFHFFGKYLLGA